VAQSKVLQGDLTVAAAEHREESKQVEQESDHCAEIFAVSAPTDQSLSDGRSFGEGQDRNGIDTRWEIHGALLRPPHHGRFGSRGSP